MFRTASRRRSGRVLLERAAPIRWVMRYAVPRPRVPRSRVLEYARPREAGVTWGSELRDIGRIMLGMVAGFVLTPITWGALAVAFLWWLASGDG